MERIGLLWLAVATVAYWASGMSTSPAWNAWVAIEFATILSFLEGIPKSDRASVLSALNLANAAAIAIGALAGAQLFTWMGGSAAGYAWLFAISSIGRLLTFVLLRRPPAVARVPEGFRLRALAVCPSGVAVQQPILASVSDGTPEAPAARERKE